MASPAEVANDMAAQAAFWARRDKDIARACDDAARVIRAFLAGERVDGRTYGGLRRRLLDLSSGRRWAHYGIISSLDRARKTLETLREEVRRCDE